MTLTPPHTPQILPTVLLLLSDQDRLHYHIENDVLYLMAGTSIKIGIPITPKLFPLLRSLRVDVANALVKGIKDVDDSEPLLILRHQSATPNDQTQPMPLG
ncbi:hypothetical protein ACQ4M3_20500 [Leptolyngbya sp. AN03gr2]|uniref:hypothetical protein n=1 Tax=unclassified Leptolyngbya TaxID=2650499 RepID=UPI003D31B75A